MALKDCKILIADDEDMLRSTLSKYFNIIGAKTLQAENGKVAFDLYQEHEIDVIISDVKMPVCDGIQFLENFVKNKKSNTIFIMITGESAMTEAMALGQGADAFFWKPITLKEVTKKIEELLARRKKS
jgi:DNA-binding response OmpR family regulator